MVMSGDQIAGQNHNMKADSSSLWKGGTVQIFGNNLNLLTPNVNYSGRTAPLTSKVAFYIFIE